MRLLVAAGTTRTAAIEGISAAGARPDAMTHTPGADAEILAYGDVVRAPEVPASPTGCPTPAVVTRAVRELTAFDVAVVDAGLAAPTGAPTVDVGATPGGDVRGPEPVPDAGEAFRAARDHAAALPDDELFVGETIPGGTTTALGVLRALGEDAPVSSSLPENPLDLKERVVAEGLDASGLEVGDRAGDPVGAVREMGDPAQAVVAGATVGALDAGKTVTLAGGTQMLAAAALVRHAGVDRPLRLATTSFLAAAAPVREAAAAHDVEVRVTDPRFEERRDHVAVERFLAGEAKEGVAMGGALALADREGVPMEAVRQRTERVYDRLL
jgi:uncharacterized protein (TIGR00303 family)